MGSTGVDSNIHVVMATIPAYGHMRPLRSLAQSLAKRGYSITFITGNIFAKSLQSIDGVEFVPLQGRADYDIEHLNDAFPHRANLPKEAMAFIFDLEHVFFGVLPDQHNTLQSVLKRPDLANKKVVVISDVGFTGTLPMFLGTKDARRVPSIGIASFPLPILSKDTAPFGLGLPPQGEEKNLELNEGVKKMMEPLRIAVDRILEPYHCTKPLPSDVPMDNMCHCQDLYYQLSVPALELPRSDLPKHVHYIGAFHGANDPKPAPEWFDSFVVDDQSGRPLVMVTSGTLAGIDANELIVPTIRACTNMPVRLVVCAVNTARPADLTLPDNVRWAEWIPFEELFKYTSLVVSSGGYGGVTQAFSAGIPMIVAGISEDKIETTARAAMTGAAINLQTATPSEEQLREALKKILATSSYKEKAMELKQAYAESDAVGTVVTAMNELTAKFYGSG